MPEARRMPVKTETLDFTDLGYPGFTCTRRTNLKMGTVQKLLAALASSDETAAREQWLVVFPEWDFVDEEGEPIPHSVDGFDLLPQELWNEMVRRSNEAVKEKAMPDPLDGDSSNPEATATKS